MIELQRNHVTPAQFLAYVRAQCRKNGCETAITLEDFRDDKNPTMRSLRIVGTDEIFCGSSESGNIVRSVSPAVIPLEPYEFTEEIFISEPYHSHIYFQRVDGVGYNEICEFSFDDEYFGHGYYYQNEWSNEKSQA